MNITLSTALTASVADSAHFLLHDLDLASLSRRLGSTYPSLNVELLVREYRRFLTLKLASRDEHAKLLSPSPLIDQVWHEHILDTRSYIGMCLAIGLWIHHDPDGADENDSVGRQIRRANTSAMYAAKFGRMDQSVWDMEGFNRPYLPGTDPFAISAAESAQVRTVEDEPAEQIAAEAEAGQNAAYEPAAEDDLDREEDEEEYGEDAYDEEEEVSELVIRVRGLDGVITRMEVTYDTQFRDIAQVYISARGLQGKRVRFFQAGWGIDAGCSFTVNELGIRNGALVTVAEEKDTIDVD